MHINEQSNKFFERLKNRDNLLGIILFGSWARGTNRENSDVDLLVILKQGFERTVEYEDGQAFEITYTTPEAAVEYWEKNWDACVGLWDVAKVIFDKDGIGDSLRLKAQEIKANGKESLSPTHVAHLKFDAEDQLKAVNGMLESDPLTAQLVLTKKVYDLTEVYFNARGLWLPAPKQRLAAIKEKNEELYTLLETFYLNKSSLQEKIEIVSEIVKTVFPNSARE